MVNLRSLVVLVLVPLAFLAACSSNNGTAVATPTRAASAVRPTPSGPNARLEPSSGPPGTEITVSGSGWPAGSELIVIGNVRGDPYVTLTTSTDGSFSTKFRLEKQPNGEDLKVGRFELIARSGATEVSLPFQVETPRPVRRPGDGG